MKPTIIIPIKTIPSTLVDVVIHSPDNKYLHGHIVQGQFDIFGNFLPWNDYDVEKYMTCEYIYDKAE